MTVRIPHQKKQGLFPPSWHHGVQLMRTLARKMISFDVDTRMTCLIAQIKERDERQAMMLEWLYEEFPQLCMQSLYGYAFDLDVEEMVDIRPLSANHISAFIGDCANNESQKHAVLTGFQDQVLEVARLFMKMHKAQPHYFLLDVRLSVQENLALLRSCETICWERF